MAYTRLLRAYYHHERAIPDGQQYRLARATTPAQRKAVDVVLAEFFALREGHWHQSRADREIARYQDKQQKAKRSAEARWANAPTHTGRNANASPDAMRTHSEGNAPKHQAPNPIPSEAKASGGLAPPSPDAADRVFALGVPMLTSANVTERNARSFLAMQSKTHGNEALLAALERCAVEKPIQPVPWLQAALKPKARQGSRHVGFDSKDYREGVTEDGHLV